MCEAWLQSGAEEIIKDRANFQLLKFNQKIAMLSVISICVHTSVGIQRKFADVGRKKEMIQIGTVVGYNFYETTPKYIQRVQVINISFKMFC